MVREESFDSFYRATRRQLLHQAFALTGDLPAAQSAVRDAYVGAWQHWRKVAPARGPARLGASPRLAAGPAPAHRPDLAPQQGPVRGAHARSSTRWRSCPSRSAGCCCWSSWPVWTLAHAARELGVTRDVAEQQPPGRATAQLADALGTDETGVRDRLAGPRRRCWTAPPSPAAPIVRRAGRKRRQGARPGRRGGRGRGRAGAPAPSPTSPSAERRGRPARCVKPQTPVDRDRPLSASAPTADNLLDRDQIRRLGLSQTWEVTHTGNNTSGDGINTVCQQSRFADPDGYAAIVRSFQAGRVAARTAVQTVEVSKTEKQAQEGFRTTVGWYAGCRVGRLQVLNAYRVDNIGDEADVLMVRIWKKPVTTMSVAVARTGRVTTSTVGTSVGASPPPAQQITQSLADAVAMLCGRSGSQDCAKRPTYRVVPPPPSGEERGILAVADLPPVGRIAQPWVGHRAGTGAGEPVRHDLRPRRLHQVRCADRRGPAPT